MNQQDLILNFFDLHDSLTVVVNDWSSRWDVGTLLTALRKHKLVSLANTAARTINEHHDVLISDNSSLMKAIKDETDAYALVSSQTAKTIEKDQLEYLFHSIAEMELRVLQFNAAHLVK